MRDGSEAAVTGLRVQAYRVPTDFPEADGTATWNSTTIIVVEAEAAGQRGIGYTYADASIVPLIEEMLAKAVVGTDAMNPPAVGARCRSPCAISGARAWPPPRYPQST